MARQPVDDAVQATLRTLAAADGSATYVAPNGSYKVVVGVNYPVEVPYRSDEIPESTVIEVNLRPHNGVATVRERHVEDLVKRTLQAVVLGDETPRTLLQLTVQVLTAEGDDRFPGGVKEGGQSESVLDLLATATNAAVLACLDAGVRMRAVAGAILIGIGPHGETLVSPGIAQRKTCSSLHVYGFASDGLVILMESEGAFDLATWQAAERRARSAVLGPLPSSANQQNGDVAMSGSNATDPNLRAPVLDVMRKALEARVVHDERWRQG